MPPPGYDSWEEYYAENGDPAIDPSTGEPWDNEDWPGVPNAPGAPANEDDGDGDGDGPEYPGATRDRQGPGGEQEADNRRVRERQAADLAKEYGFLGSDPGNLESFLSGRATWEEYLADTQVRALSGGSRENGGYNTSWADDDPRRFGPVDDPPPGYTGTGWQPGAGGGGSGGTNWTGLFTPYSGSFQAPDYAEAARQAMSVLPGVPTYRAPSLPDIQPFQAPTYQEAVSDPGYQFRLQQGTQALENSKAAQGLSRTGGTLKDFMNYGQNMASQEYGNTWNRRLGEYNTNVGNIWEKSAREQGIARDEYAPQFAQWETQSQVANQGANNAYNRAWNEYLQDYRQYQDQNQNVFDRLKWGSEFGLDAATR